MQYLFLLLDVLTNVIFYDMIFSEKGFQIILPYCFKLFMTLPVSLLGFPGSFMLSEQIIPYLKDEHPNDKVIFLG